MKNIKKFARTLMLIFIIALAAILPVPVTLYSKDNAPKFRLEQVEEKEEESEEGEIKEIK